MTKDALEELRGGLDARVFKELITHYYVPKHTFLHKKEFNTHKLCIIIGSTLL